MGDIRIDELKALSLQALIELLSEANLKEGNIVIFGCSTSEIAGQKIGSASNIGIANAIIDGVLPQMTENNLFLAAQCCEHLNRSIVIEQICANTYNLDIVAVVPHLRAGGAFATEVFRRFDDPVIVEHISAHAGIDIGDTFIGMHLKNIAVPVRGKIKEIGSAHLTMALTRPKLIGGERSLYTKYETPH